MLWKDNRMPRWIKANRSWMLLEETQVGEQMSTDSKGAAGEHTKSNAAHGITSVRGQDK